MNEERGEEFDEVRKARSGREDSKHGMSE